MNPFDNIAVVIPVREGSQRVPNKIHLPFGPGHSLLSWKIEQLKQVQRPERIFLSSNSERVRQIAAETGVRFLPRREHLCVGHQASFSDVITGIVADLPTQHFAWVTVVVPLMRPEEYREAFEIYLDKVVRAKSHDSLVTVNQLHDYLWGQDRPINYQADRNHTISQELPGLFRVTNGLYMRDCGRTLSEGYFLGANPIKHIVAKISGVDIDEQEDYDIALSLKGIYDRSATL
ncbi:MAG: acylneuraminate cytidylyltransferase [Pseudomonadota bacterium]